MGLNKLTQEKARKIWVLANEASRNGYAAQEAEDMERARFSWGYEKGLREALRLMGFVNVLEIDGPPVLEE